MEPLVIVVLVIIVVAILLWLYVAPKNYVGCSAAFDNNRRLARPGGAAIQSCCGGK
jgi:ABC-type uncharacterized transport system permease subunit